MKLCIFFYNTQHTFEKCLLQNNFFFVSCLLARRFVYVCSESCFSPFAAFFCASLCSLWTLFYTRAKQQIFCILHHTRLFSQHVFVLHFSALTLLYRWYDCDVKRDAFTDQIELFTYCVIKSWSSRSA